MSNTSLLEIFKNKFEQGKLAHFYIFESNSQDQGHIDNWLMQTLKSIIGKDLSLGHEDIEIIETEDDNYKIDSDEARRLYSFISFAPLKLKYKFLIIKDAQKISKIFSNKLLKILEEPPKNTIIIVTNPHNASILPTIKSRAIVLRLNQEKDSRPFQENDLGPREWFGKFYPKIKLESISQVLADLKAKSIDEKTFVRLYIEYLSSSNIDGGDLAYEIDKLKELQINTEYNQSINSRYLPLLDTIFES